MPTNHYKGPEAIDRGDGTYQCPIEGCTLGEAGGPYVTDKQMGVKQHVSRSHKDLFPPESQRRKNQSSVHADDIFKTVAKVTQALVADAPNELYDRMEEIVEVRKFVARYLGKRYSS